MRPAKSEAELGDRVSEYIKAELKRANVTYVELAKLIRAQGFKTETVDSIKSKLKRGSFSAAFLIAVCAAIGREGIDFEDV